MAFVVIGVLLIVLKLNAIGMVAGLSWLWVLSPFALAVVWWTWSDNSGRTARKAMDKLDERKSKRRDEAMEKLGIDSSKRSKK